MGLSVVYEDAALVVVEKPAGLSSETGVPDALRELWQSPDAYVGIVHRLDTPVSGLMVYAKTPAAAAALSRQVTENTLCKVYRAVVADDTGSPLPAEGTLRDYLFKDSRAGRVYPVKRLRKGVKEAVLDYRTIATHTDAEGQLCLVEITLHTGRTHQIRAQFSSRRHPLWGDGKYGSRRKGALALQCAQLSFCHPVSGQKIDFALPMPPTVPWSLF